MSLLFRIVYAGHANGTHHKLALDGLASMSHPDAAGWQRLFLKHAERFMVGSKAPDDTFKDFKNHVLHVGDNYWGGAPEAACEWYGKTFDALRAQHWEEAVYAAGVLTHYYADPVMPFHTGQTDAENAIHRATEWSINRSYNDLRALGLARAMALGVPTRAGPQWLKEMVCDGAEISHKSYERLIAHYDITRGVGDPPAGLDSVARNLVGELLVYAARGIGQILDRAVAEAAVTPPEVSLTLDTVMAAIKIPAKALAKRLSNAADRSVVEAMYDELKATGKVERTLPEDDRMVRDLHAQEVQAPKAAALAAARAARLVASSGQVAPAEPVRLKTAIVSASADQPFTASHAPAARKPLPQPASLSARLATVDNSVTAPRPYLAAGDHLEAAPSIGPRMAQRLADLGIATVADFMGTDAGDMAVRLADRRIDAALIAAWQAQAGLVMSIPGLRGSHAQLLVGSGFLTPAAIADADAADLSAAVLQYATTPEGRRLLRDGTAPDLDRIKGWVDLARAAAKAA